MSARGSGRVKELYLEVVDLEPRAQEERLAGADVDADTLAAVRSLLDANRRAEAFFDDERALAPIAALAAGARGANAASDGSAGPADEPDEVPLEEAGIGRTIGAYRLEGLLGRGGMGSVWLAHRVDGQFQQQVAIKLLSLSALGAESHRRFLAEREILAHLQHPGIAPLFDGGVTEDGTPYFVMEYVRGAPIDAHCDAQTLDVAQRVALFLQVCDALAYAHDKGIVHRDIKPQNVLVSEGQVRLLDFGIAKLMQEKGDLAAHIDTATGQAPMTPAYASPEQLRAAPVTPATDVYALGLLLHELLTGDLPHRARGESGLALVRAILEDAVERPSARFATRTAGADPDLEDLARVRGATCAALERRLRGDLDTILLLALRKEPERRYPDARALADDLRRHLAGQPVLARAESRLYRTSRFLGRHRSTAAVTVAALIVLGVVGGAALWLASKSNQQGEQIVRERGRADELLAHLSELYESADPSLSPQASAAARGLLDAAVVPLREDVIADRELRAGLLFAAGRVYRRLSALDEALPLLEESLALRREFLEAPDEELCASLFQLGICRFRSGDVEGGTALLAESLEGELALHGTDHVHVAQVRYELGNCYHDAGLPDADVEFREAIRIYRASESQASDEYASALIALAQYVSVTGGMTQGVELLEEALAILDELHDGGHPAQARALDGLGLLHYNMDQPEKGIELLEEALRINRGFYADEGHTDLAWNLLNLGRLQQAEGIDAGVERIREAIEMYASLSDTTPSLMAFAQTSLGHALRSRDPAAAAQAYEDALAEYERGGARALFGVGTKQALADLLLRGERHARALELLGEIADTYAEHLGPDNPRTLNAAAALEAALAP